MTDPNLTEIVFVMDRSGSMCSITNEAIGSFNAFLAEQKALDKPCRLTYAQFDHQYEVVHEAVPIVDVDPLSVATYQPRGSTALYDAICQTVLGVGTRLAALSEEQRPGKIVFVILTDGHENASQEFNCAKVQEMVEHQQEKYQWEFVFLAANQDAVFSGGQMGIQRNYNFKATGQSVQTVCDNMSTAVRSFRAAPDSYAATVALDIMVDNAMDVQGDSDG